MTKDEKKDYIDNLLQEYHDLDYEDIIGGGTVLSRFKYSNTKTKDYGLTDEELLLLDDNQLNRMVSMKKIQPYRDDEAEENHVNLHKVRQLKHNFKQDVKNREVSFGLCLMCLGRNNLKRACSSSWSRRRRRTSRATSNLRIRQPRLTRGPLNWARTRRKGRLKLQ
jgi:protein KRI1